MPSPPDPGIVWASLAQILAAVVAVFVARRRKAHRPVAFFLVVQVIANLVHEALRLLVLVPAREASGSAPFTGATRHVWELTTAVGLMWPAGLALLAVVLLLARPRVAWSVVAVWVVASTAIAVGYPVTRGLVLARVLFGAEVAAFCTCVGAIIWRQRTGRRPHIEHFVFGLLFMLELAQLFVWRENVFGGWIRAQSMQVVIYGAIAAIQGVSLWFRGGAFLRED